jgi:biopolymer transport protein ExbB
LQGQELSNEQRELKVDEAILQELPGLERGQSFIKLLAAVAPLLGLLGTVIGMIATFQSITLFGTSDPKLMAGGISQALMTTVLGLVVAIPLLFCHSYLATRGRRLTQILQEKSLGLLAETTTSDSNIGAFDRAA